MGGLSEGQSIGTWKSAMGQATIKVKQEIGDGFATQDAAAKAAFGKEAVLTQEGDGKFHAYTIDDGAYWDDLQMGESVSLKKGIPNVQVLDVIGDDNFQMKATRKTMPPIGKDNGKVVYFMRRYEKGIQNFGMDKIVDSARRWDEEIRWARKQGYTVVLDANVTTKEMQDAFYDPKAAGVIFTGHGGDGGIYVDRGDDTDAWFGPNSLEKSKVSKNLKMVSFQSCETGNLEKDWQDVTHGARIDAWKRVMNVVESAAANDPGWFAAGASLVSPTLGAMLPAIIPHQLGKLMRQTL